MQRCAEKARAVPRLAGKARGAAQKRNDRGRNDKRRMEIVAKTRDEQMLRAWARSGGELRRWATAAATRDGCSSELLLCVNMRKNK